MGSGGVGEWWERVAKAWQLGEAAAEDGRQGRQLHGGSRRCIPRGRIRARLVGKRFLIS